MTPLQHLQELRQQLQAKSLVIRLSSGQDEDDTEQVFCSIAVYPCTVENPDITDCHNHILLECSSFEYLTEQQRDNIHKSTLISEPHDRCVRVLSHSTYDKPWILASCFYLYLCERSDMYTSYIVLNESGYEIFVLYYETSSLNEEDSHQEDYELVRITQ